MSNDARNRELAAIRKGDRVDVGVDGQGYMRPDGVIQVVKGDDFAPFGVPFGRASDDGITGLEIAENGAPQRIAVDEYGHVWVNAVVPPPTPITLSYYDSASFQTSQVVSAVAARLWNVFAHHNVPGTTLYVQVFNAAAVPPPGATALISLPVETEIVANLSYESNQGRPFSNGIVVALSTTDLTFTPYVGAGGALFNVGFEP